jgi:hypothetical protein
MIASDGIHLKNVARLPSGFAIAAKFRDVTLINTHHQDLLGVTAGNSSIRANYRNY